MARTVKPYAQRMVRTMRNSVEAANERGFATIDTAEVITKAGGIKISPHGDAVVYDEDDLVWGIDPDSLKKGDSVILGRDTAENPIVLAKADGMQPDPSVHPDYIAFKKQFNTLRGQSRTWKSPVATLIDLPARGNSRGDVRLVLDTGILYRWRASLSSWDAISGGSGATDLDDLTDVTLTAPTLGQVLYYDGAQWVNFSLPGVSPNDLDDLTDVAITAPAAGQVLEYNGSNFVNVAEHWVDTAGDTMTDFLTLHDHPVLDYHAATKLYVDDAIAAALGGSVTLVPTVIVSTAFYAATPNDQAILVNYCAGAATVELPASHIDQKIYEIKDIGGCASTSGGITIISADGDTIDGGASAILNVDYQSITVISDGSDWFII